MRNYSQVVYKQLKVNKRRNYYTVIGIVIGIVLLVTISEIKLFNGEVDLQQAKTTIGNYEVELLNLSKTQMELLKTNVKVKDASFAALDYSGKLEDSKLTKNINIYALDDNVMKNVFDSIINIDTGRLPQRGNEIILEKNSKDIIGKDIGDEIESGKSKYVIVGFFKKTEYNTINTEAITYFNKDRNYSESYSFVNMKNTKDKIKAIKTMCRDIGLIGVNGEVDFQHINFNENILNKYGYIVKSENNICSEVQVVEVIFYVMIFLIIALLIYSTINISTREKVKYLGLLRCLGASPDKIRFLLLKESIILGLMSIIPGLIIGHLLASVIVNIGFVYIAKMNFYGVTFRLYWSVIISVAILTMVTIFISLIIPVIKASRIPPIEGIKNGGDLIKSNKLIKSKFIRSLFGYKGELAYKNIRSNRKSFTLINLTLILILVSFVIFTGYFSIMIKEIKSERIKNERNFEIFFNSKINIDNIKDSDSEITSLEKHVEYLNKNKNIKDIFAHIRTGTIPVLEDSNIKEEDQGDLFILDEKSLSDIMPYVKGENVTLENLNENSVTLIKTPFINNIPEMHIDKVKNGYFKTFSYYRDENSNQNTETMYNSAEVNMKVIGTIDSKYIPFGDSLSYSKGIYLIASREFYEKNKSAISNMETIISPSIQISFNFLNLDKINETSEVIAKYVNENGGWCLYNYSNSIKDIRSLLGMSIIMYTILFLLIFIGVINIINSKNITVSLRKKEFGTFLAIGMDRHDLKKLIILEGIVQWFISTIIGGIISYIGLKIIVFILWYSGDIKTIEIPTWIIAIGIIILLLINLVSSVIPLRRFKKFDTTEMMRNEE